MCEYARERPDGNKWREHHLRQRKKLQMAENSKPWTGRRPRVALRGVRDGLKCKSPRILDIIDIGYGAYLQNCKESQRAPELRPSWFCEVGTSAERAPWGPDLQTVSTKAKYYYYHGDTILSVAQLSHLHGYPSEKEDTDGIPENRQRQLLGNAVYLPHMTICIAAAFCITDAPWHGADYKQHGKKEPGLQRSAAAPGASPASTAISSKRRKIRAPM